MLHEKLFEIIQQLVSSPEFMKESRATESSFTRERKLPFQELVLFFLKGVAKTTSVEIAEYFQQMNKEQTVCSKQAVSKARQNLRHEAFTKLNDAIMAEYYRQKPKTYKGFRLLAADGSMIELPDGEAIGTAFGTMNHKKDWINCGWSMVLYDILNGMVVDAELHKYGESERVYLMKQLERMKVSGKQYRDIIVADRGFPSLALFVKMQDNGYDFVIRYNGEHFLKEFTEFANSKRRDEILEIHLDSTEKRRNNPQIKELVEHGAKEKIRLRAVKIELPNGTDEYLVTSVLEKTVLSKKDLKKIYRMRWNEEEHFKMQKRSAEIENFSGRTVESIKQDYYSRILILNLHSAIVQDCDEQIETERKKKKGKMKYRKYKVNRNVSYGIVRSRILELLNSENAEWESAYDEIVEAVKRHKIPVREGRNYPRVKKWHLKYPPNQRRAV